MRDAFLRARERADVVLVSGGLGPTRDDLTVEVLAQTFGRELVLHEPSLAAIRAFFARLGREMAEINAKQALAARGRRRAREPRRHRAGLPARGAARGRAGPRSSSACRACRASS